MIAFAWMLFTIFYLFMVVILSWQFNHYKNEGNESATSVSIIIAARNELENLKLLVPELLKQNYEHFEIIIALDRCTDESLKFLNSITYDRLKFIEINNVPIEWNSKKYALSEAINKAKSEWLLFTDADCIPLSKNWISSFTSQISDAIHILIGYSPYRQESSFLSSYIQFESFHTGYLYLSAALSGRPYMAVGRNMAIRKTFFNSVSGYETFKSALGGDDDLFIQKNATSHNTGIVMGKDSLVETYPKKTWKDYFIQKRRHLSIGSRYKPSHKLFLSLYHTSHFIFWIFLFFQTNYQIITGVVLFYLFIKLGSYRFAASKMGAGFNYILLPLVDIGYAILTPMIALWSKLEKDIRWKN
ncbi:MAG: glycosyltransferase [Ekhidna sp.]